jgi:DNA gyrase/topoisomerase IV subunit B
MELVQRRPGMYIGDTTDGSGLHHMIDELVDNAINEALAGHCDRLQVALNARGSVTVRDNGRGIPTDVHPSEGVSAPEFIMTRLHAAALFKNSAQQMSEKRLQGAGVAVVNALSDVLELRIWREGKEHFIRFRAGHPEAPLTIVGNADVLDGKSNRGTEITFSPSARFFAKTEFDFDRIEQRLRGLASLNAGLTIVLTDKRGVQEKEIVLRIWVRAPHCGVESKYRFARGLFDRGELTPRGPRVVSGRKSHPEPFRSARPRMADIDFSGDDVSVGHNRGSCTAVNSSCMSSETPRLVSYIRSLALIFMSALVVD